MPSVSKAQQRGAGAELRRRRLGQAPHFMADMSLADLEDYAGTPRKGLPARASRKKPKK